MERARTLLLRGMCTLAGLASAWCLALDVIEKDWFRKRSHQQVAAPPPRVRAPSPEEHRPRTVIRVPSISISKLIIVVGRPETPRNPPPINLVSNFVIAQPGISARDDLMTRLSEIDQAAGCPPLRGLGRTWLRLVITVMDCLTMGVRDASWCWPAIVHEAVMQTLMDDILNDDNTRVYSLPTLTTPATDTKHTPPASSVWPRRDTAIKPPTTRGLRRVKAT